MYKYIYKSGKNHYIIEKTINYERNYFGTYKNISDAMIVRNELIKSNWTYSKSMNELRIIKRRINKNRYIQRTPNGKYAIYKQIHGTSCATYFGTFNTIKEAIGYRNYLECKNWDTSLIKFTKKHRNNYSMRHIKKVKYTHKDGTVKITYKIQKCLHGRSQNFGTFNKLEDAINERNVLESVNWDYDVLLSLPNDGIRYT